MKKLTVFLAIMVLLTCTFAYADTNNFKQLIDAENFKIVKNDKTLFQLKSEMYEDGILTSEKVISVSGNYYTKKIRTGKEVINGITYYYENDINYTSETDGQILYFIGDIPVGTDTIDLYIKWIDTWLVDEYGNRIELVSSSDPTIETASNSYTVSVGFTLWRDAFTYNSESAASSGKIDSIYGGTVSYNHYVSVYNYMF